MMNEPQFDFQSIPSVVQDRFLELLPDTSRFEFRCINQFYFHQCFVTEKKLDVVEKLEIVIHKPKPNQMIPDQVEDLKGNNMAATKELSIICTDFDWFTRKIKLADEITVFMLVTAKYLEKLHIENVMMSKSFLLDFVKKCQNLEELTIKNCIIDETIDVGMDLLVLIPKCKTLCLEGTPEFTTNVFSALDLKVHTLEHGNFSKLTIDPFFPVKNLKVIDDLKNSCQTPIELVCFYDTASSPINSRSDDQFIIKTLTLFLYYFYFPICNSFSSFHSIVADDSENTSFFSGYSWSVVIMWILHFIFQRRFIKFFRRKPSLFRYLYRQTKFQQEFREKFPLAIGCIHTLCMAFLIGTRWLEFPKIVSNLNFVLIFAIHFVMIEFVLLLFNFVLFLYQKFMSKD